MDLVHLWRDYYDINVLIFGFYLYVGSGTSLWRLLRGICILIGPVADVDCPWFVVLKDFFITTFR